MTEAVDVLHAMERLIALLRAEPGTDPAALQEATALLLRMGHRNGAAGYRAEKLQVVHDGFERWFGAGAGMNPGADPTSFREQLRRDIEHLRKALARGSEGQD
jgi:hypothetical protein